jgi:hypothetical protein
MAIPDAIKTNFHTLERAFENGDIALLECRNRTNGEPAYAICAINLSWQAGREPEIEMVPISLMFNDDPYEMLVPASDPEFDRSGQQRVPGTETGVSDLKNHRRKGLTKKKEMKAGGRGQERRRET